MVVYHNLSCVGTVGTETRTVSQFQYQYYGITLVEPSCVGSLENSILYDGINFVLDSLKSKSDKVSS